MKGKLISITINGTKFTLNGCGKLKKEEEQLIMSDEQIIKEFLTQYVNQDTQGTAKPIYYTIRTSKEIEDFNGELYWLIPNWDFTKIEAQESVTDPSDCSNLFLAWCKYQNFNPSEELLNSTDWVDFCDDEVEEITISRDWEEKGMFLTETDAKNHLKANDYHYSDDAHLYIKHAWRAPELTNFLNALFRHFNIDQNNLR